MEIFIKNKQPVPAIYNVKQFSEGADRFIFYVPKGDLRVQSGLSGKVKSERFVSSVGVRAAGDFFVLEWVPSALETKVSGCFEVQIELAAGEFVWESYKAVFIVSSSIEGGEPDVAVSAVSEDFIMGVLKFDGFVDDGVIGEAAVVG